MPLPAITAVDVDGLPTFWADIRTDFTGTLVFGVGLRDETARTAGLAHLIEHLVMARVGRVNISHNATTSDESISFYAQGTPAAVADFLAKVGNAISTLHETTDELVAEQRRIISNELGDSDERPGRGHLIDRFGNQSLGLLDLGTPAHRSHTRDEVIHFADQWLHADNAALSFTGPVPDGLAITLPSGRPLPTRVEPAIIRDGQWVVNGDTPVVLSLAFPVSDMATAGIAAGVAAEALHEGLRTQRHLIYSVATLNLPLSREIGLVGFALDPRPEHVVEAAAGALDIVRRLATAGPTEQEVADQIDKWRQGDEDSTVQADAVDGRAISVLRGRRSRDDETPPASPDNVTAESVRALFSHALDSVFVTMGEDLDAESEEKITEALGLPPAEDPDPHFISLSKWQLISHYTQNTTEVFSGKLFAGARGSELVVDEERVSLVEDGVFEVRYDDIVLATYSAKHRLWTLIAAHGHILFVDLDQWRGAKKLHELLGQRIPGWAQCEVDAA